MKSEPRGRNGLIGTPNLARTRYQTHYLHARSRGGREQRERNGQKAAEGERDTRIQRPVKNVGQSTPVPLLFFFFFFSSLQIARMHHADPRLRFTREPEFWK